MTAITRQFKPDLYSQVDDDATIFVEYPSAIVVIQASWYWPHGVKDMSLSCESGDLITHGADRLTIHPSENPISTKELSALEGDQQDPFAHLAAVVQGDVSPHPLCSIENNLIVMQILDAARRSAESGERVLLE